MSTLKSRYNLTPQMKYYDQISCEFKPFVMFFNKKNFSSAVVNTDSNGFRLNYYKNKLSKFDNCNFETEVSLVIGGSTVFGFGATNDTKTISSQLSILTDEIYLNFGATAFSSMQELILFINFFQKFKKIKNIIIISGINDLFLSMSQKTDIWGNYFFKSDYEMLHTQKKTLKDKISYLFKKNNNNGHNFDIDLNTIYLNYEKIFNTWSNLKKGNNFNLYFFLQPFPNWFNKNLSNEELELFNLLDNSNLEAHRILKKISNLNFYKNFLNILKETTKNSSINFVNLNDKILGSDKSREWLFVDRVHMTDLGYSVLTKIILDNIK